MMFGVVVNSPTPSATATDDITQVLKHIDRARKLASTQVTRLGELRSMLVRTSVDIARGRGVDAANATDAVYAYVSDTKELEQVDISRVLMDAVHAIQEYDRQKGPNRDHGVAKVAGETGAAFVTGAVLGAITGVPLDAEAECHSSPQDETRELNI